MTMRAVLTAGLLLILWQYVGFSPIDGLVIIPELGVLLLVVVRGEFSALELACIALGLGYLADMLGAAEQGSVLAGYVTVAGLLVALRKVPIPSRSLRNLVAVAVALVGFHAVVALVASPVVLRQWAGIVAVQLIGACALLIANAWAQRTWGPLR